MLNATYTGLVVVLCLADVNERYLALMQHRNTYPRTARRCVVRLHTMFGAHPTA